MSTKPDTRSRGRTVPITLDEPLGPGPFRLLALSCVLTLIASYVTVLREVTHVVGGTRSLLLLVSAMMVAATLLGRIIRPRTATVAALGAAGIGFAYYLQMTGVGVSVALSATDAIVSDTIALATGLSVLRMVEAGLWSLGFAPGPAFLSWYLALRGRYALSIIPGGVALLFLVLTGDAGTIPTLAGTLGGIGAVGFGELERYGGSVAQADLLAMVFAAITVLSLSVTVLPGNSTGPAFVGGDGTTLEGAIDTADERSSIAGPVELSPEVRFTVESDKPSYWRTGVYDRFTGDEWVRSGSIRAYDGPLDAPPSQYETVTHTITAETQLGVMPAAPQPVSLSGDPVTHAEVSTHGQPQPAEVLAEGDQYTVESAVITPDPDALRAAGTDYPVEILDGHDYLQTPGTPSSEFTAHTAEVTADAETPYDAAVAIEQHLRSTKGYSLTVEKPSGNVAEAFLLEMDEGYCVYFATTMVQMLRTEGIPARYVTGYTTGQQINDDEYLVRGLNAHAWVEVYFPGHGWVAFDPTPGDTREDVHTDQLEQAREAGRSDVDTEESENVSVAEDFAEQTQNNESNGFPNTIDHRSNSTPDEVDSGGETNGSLLDGAGSSGDAGDTNDGWLSSLVSITREQATVGLVILGGLAAGAHRTGASGRVRREVRLYWQGRRRDPDHDVRRAYRRLERLLARQYRPRYHSESSRQYLAALSANEPIDPRAMQVAQYYERARYGGGVDRTDADKAIETVDELTREQLPIMRHFH